MESVQLEHEDVTQLVLVSLRDGVEEGRRLSNEEKDPFERIDRGAVLARSKGCHERWEVKERELTSEYSDPMI